MQNGTLSGKTAVVIGASSGIGLATANLLADSGATVHAAARRKDAIEAGAVGRAVPAYQASKAGMTELAHAAGFEEHQNGVRFTAILPGIVDTPILDNRPEPPPKEVREASLQAGDVAQACLFLATLPPRAYVPELTMVPTMIQALGKASTATPPMRGEE